MQELTTDGLLAALRGWVEIESPTQDVAAVNRMADHVEAKLRAIGAAIERTPGRDGFGDILIGRIAGEQPGPGPAAARPYRYGPPGRHPGRQAALPGGGRPRLWPRDL